MKLRSHLPGIRSVGKLPAAVARGLMGTITHVATQDAVAALTFDDGPHPEFTPYLLDILEGFRARATFFMVGIAAQRYPAVVRRMAEAGHAIGNHSWDHPSFPLIGGRERREQIRACARAVAPYGQRLFRPPYGHQSLASRLDAWMLGYQVVTWNVLAHDWLDRGASWMADRLVVQIQPGSIVLLHDGLFDAPDEQYFDRAAVLETVEILLKRLGTRLRFVTIPELLRHGRPQRENWFAQGNPDFLNRLIRIDGEARQYALGPDSTEE